MILDTIKSIRKVGIRKTIDIKVDGDNLFLCNGILTHNSAAGDTNDVSEENIQGGIAKIQAADNVMAFIPSSTERDVGGLTAKMLKTRDSGGVGQYINFKTDWPSLSFNPWDKKADQNGNGDDGKSADVNEADWKAQKKARQEKQAQKNERLAKQISKKSKENKSTSPESNDTEPVTPNPIDDEKPPLSKMDAIRGVKNTKGMLINKTGQKRVKLM